MKLVKIGNVIKTSIVPESFNKDKSFKKEFLYIMVDTENKFYEIIINNKEFIEKYNLLKTKNIINIGIAEVDYLEIGQEVKTIVFNILSLQEKTKIIEIFDDIIITEKNLLIVDDTSFYRDKILNKLGI